ncbi:MAG: hypothetical protein ACKVX9_12710 [Blastocatellia bacterium]
MSAQQIADEEIEVVLRTLRAADEPMTRSQLRQALPSGRFKLPDGRIADILAELMRRELVFQFKPYGGKHERYWTRRIDEYARITILAAFAGNPLTRSDFVKKTAARLKDITEDKRRALLNQLVKEGAIHRWPPLIGRSAELFSTRQIESQVYFRHVLGLLENRLGIPKERLLEEVAGLQVRQALIVSADALAAPPAGAPDYNQILLDGMVRLKPSSANGALVSLTELRRFLREQIPDKASFDAAVLRLAEQETLALHYHDFPASLSPNELEELVTDGCGHFYIGAALRT